MSAALVLLVLTLGGGAETEQRVYLPEGWYQVEEGWGETPDEVAIVFPDTDPASGQVDGGSEPDLSQEIARFARVDCEEARGRYLERILELYGVSTFALDPRALAAWTPQLPAQVEPAYEGILSEPAMALLWGKPPVPPGLLSSDLTLQELAKDLLSCQGRAQVAPPPPPTL